MDETILAFIVWAAIGALFIAIGISAFFAKKATGFWANAKTFPVEDVKGYNRAMGKLWGLYGAAMILLGLPFLAGEDSPLILLVSVPGMLIGTIAVMCVYTLVIEKKYRKKQ